MTPFILALALIGQHRQCTTAQAYAQRQAVTGYTTGYTQAYATQAYTPAYQTFTTWVAVEPPYAELVNATGRAEAQAQASADLTELVGRLAASVERIERRINGEPTESTDHVHGIVSDSALPGVGGRIIPGTDNDVPPPPKPEPPKVTVPAKVLGILKTSCAKCHSGDTAKGDLTLFDAGGNFVQPSPLDLLRIDQTLYAGTMPPKKPLTESEYSDIRAWIDQDRASITAMLKGAKAKSTSKETSR